MLLYFFLPGYLKDQYKKSSDGGAKRMACRLRDGAVGEVPAASEFWWVAFKSLGIQGREF